MNLKQKLIAGLIFLSLAFSGGVWVGFHMDRGLDPQQSIQSVFTPFQDGTAAYLDFLDRAQPNGSVYVADYTFTEEKVADKLIQLKTHRHCAVHVLLDLSETRASAKDQEQPLIDKMKAAGIEVVVGTSPKHGAIMHNKFTVVDGVWVESGSWNYTGAANDQANEFDVIKSPSRATLFLSNWHKLHDFMQAQEARRAARKSR